MKFGHYPKEVLDQNWAEFKSYFKNYCNLYPFWPSSQTNDVSIKLTRICNKQIKRVSFFIKRAGKYKGLASTDSNASAIKSDSNIEIIAIAYFSIDWFDTFCGNLAITFWNQAFVKFNDCQSIVHNRIQFLSELVKWLCNWVWIYNRARKY